STLTPPKRKTGLQAGSTHPQAASQADPTKLSSIPSPKKSSASHKITDPTRASPSIKYQPEKEPPHENRFFHFRCRHGGRIGPRPCHGRSARCRRRQGR